MRKGEMNTFLVTGVAGFIGRSIAAELLRRGKRVRGIDNFTTGKRENLCGLEAMDFIEADINDAAAMAEACREVECIFHEAAIPSVPRSVEDPVSSNHAGVSGTVQLLVAAKNAKVRRVVYAGSSSVYGNTLTLPTPTSGRQRSDLAMSRSCSLGRVSSARLPGTRALPSTQNLNVRAYDDRCGCGWIARNHSEN